MSMQQTKPLRGIKVLDFTRLYAGPFCTMLLADLGADVAKIEPPGGDPIRMQGPPFHDGTSLSFLAVNRNKRSITLDTRTDEGRETALKLAKEADVVVENFRPGVMERMGLGYEALKAQTPALIYVAMSGMGATGPMKGKGAFDLTIQAEGGYMSITGERDGKPIKLGTSVFDLVCGQYAMGAIMTALFRRERTGEGERIETSLFESEVTYLVDAAMEYLLVGTHRPKWGSEHSTNVPYKAFPAADGWIVIGAGVQRLFEALVKVLGREDLLADARFRTMGDRVAHRDELYAILDAEVLAWKVDELCAALDAAAVPAAPVNDMRRVFEHPQTQARNMLVHARTADGGAMPMIGSAMTFASFDVAEGWTAPPKPGEHTDEILRDWLGAAPASARSA